MKKLYTLLAAFILISTAVQAQHTFTHGNNSFEISGYLISYYQYRPTFAGDPNANDHHKNTFALDDARLVMKGYVKGGFKYELEANFADLVTIAINGIKDIKSAPLTEANISYSCPYINIKAGYFKLPTSASSLVDKIPSPFTHRATIANGDYFSRRDVGLLLNKDFWHQRVNIYAGIVSGMGEQILLGDGDPNGKPEYLARLELSSAYYRDEELDTRDLALPLARVAGNVRYNQKTTFTGNGDATFALDNAKTIDGTKITYGVDAGFMWHGFSAQFEMDHARMSPRNGTPLFNQLALYNTTYFRHGGYLVQVNYYSKLLRSAVGLRYDEFNASDLVGGAQQRTLGIVYNFIWAPYNLTLKVHYDYRFKQPNLNQKWAEDQLRIAVQYTF